MAKVIDLDDVAVNEAEARSRYRWRIKVCSSTACDASGAGPTYRAVEERVEQEGLEHDVQVVPTGCMGLCSAGPLVRTEPRGGQPTLFQEVNERVGADIVERHVKGREDLAEHQLDEGLPFFTRQERVVLSNAGRIDPERLEDYVAEGGYRALVSALRMRPRGLIETIEASGLRGRGGAGYPTAKKWGMLHDAVADEKYVVANGDEGDPGAFMDRAVMEDDPHRVLEGVTLAAYATGASKAFLYVRAEYPRAIKRLEQAIRTAKRQRLLGRNILGSDFSLDVEIRTGAGAFVCGEETALLASIEGQRGQPRMRPPYPTERGLYGRPTMINNVETLANLPDIVRRGPEWFRRMGTEVSPGTKVFALAGSLRHTGLIEVPMGLTLGEIIEEIGGGCPDGRAFKAAQTGGPSGGCVPASFRDLPVDFESLRQAGSIMGSGGLIAMDEGVSMPEVARFYMDFSQDESCGKCTPCRVGTLEMHRLLERICAGEGSHRDLELLEQLSRTVRETSLCGLGQSAPNPVASTLEHFRDEYLALLRDEPVGVAHG